jgi:hypothetical protein
MFDDYGPLQAQLPGGGQRFYGATGRLNFCEEGPVQQLVGYYMAGSGGGDVKTLADDSWYGAEAAGTIPGRIGWQAQFAQRQRAGFMDPTAYRLRFDRYFEDVLGGFLHGLSYVRTDSEGPLHVNPGDFNTAGLLHQYGGAWRSDLDTNQFIIATKPGWDVDFTVTMLTLDRDGQAVQLGHFETDFLVSKQLKPGIYAAAGYGFDNDERQVGYFQLTCFF